MKEEFKSLFIPIIFLISFLLLPSAYLKYEVVFTLIVSLSILGVIKFLDAGLVNFGYGMYVALGAYTAALMYKYLKINEIIITVPISLLIGFIFGYIFGKIVQRYRGIFFALLNLSLSMVVYGILVKMYYYTGGSDGISIPSFTLFGMRGDLNILFLFSLLFFSFALLFRIKYINSSLFWNAVGLRENELRLPALGIEPNRVILRVNIISAMFGSVSGVLIAYLTGHVTPDLTFWSYSSFLVIGGVIGFYFSSIYGFILGAIALRLINIIAYYYIYELTIGISLISLLIFMLIKEKRQR